jgi:YVTN family beta-propeller protein
MNRPIVLFAFTTAMLVFAEPCFAGKIFVSNEKDNTVTVLDTDTYEVIATIPVGRRPRGVILSPDYKELFVAAGDGDIMDVIDTATLKKSRELESGPDPELMAVDPKGEKIYIANEDDSLVTIMDIKSGDVLGEVPVGVEPEGMAVSPDNKYTVATSESTSMAHVIDNEKKKLIANVLVDCGRARQSSPPTARSFGSPPRSAAPSRSIPTTGYQDKHLRTARG